MPIEARSKNHCCCEEPKKKWKWYKDKLLITFSGTVLLLILGLVFPFLKPFDLAFWRYTKMTWWAITLGIILGGIIDYYIPQTYISKYLAKRKKRTIFYSVALGFLMSSCSHGILALSMELYKKGARGPAVISFLLASPWANLPVTLLLFGFFGSKGALMIISALVIALITGLVMRKLEEKNMIETNPNSIEVDENFSVRKDIRRRWKEYHFTFNGLIGEMRGIGRGMWDLSEMVLWWIMIGFVMASFIGAFVPAHVFQKFLGPSLLGLLLTLIFAVILEVCSEGTAPLAFEIYRQTGALGNSFTFLMAGVATDYTEIGLVWTNIGRKTALWMIILCVPQILFLGWIFNLFF